MSTTLGSLPSVAGTGETPATRRIRDTDAGNGEMFANARGLVEALKEAETSSAAYLAGGADPHSVVEAIARAELAVETVVTVRNKIVEAYQELMRMPI